MIYNEEFPFIKLHGPLSQDFVKLHGKLNILYLILHTANSRQDDKVGDIL